MSSSAEPRAVAQFEHTHFGAYLVGAFAVACLFSDSAQGFIERNRLNRKWLLLYGVLCVFAYLYARPFIRVGLGSAQRGYINFSTLYIVWLCSAVFYHLPSLEQLGVDVRADVSMLIVLFLSSLAALALLAGLHTAAVSLWLLPRRAYLSAVAAANARGPGGSGIGAARAGPGFGSRSGSGGGLRELWALLLLNSMIIAVACSTYYSFCGNGTLVVDADTNAFKAAVCAKWLHPILTVHYPRFASWMLYGEGSAYKLTGSSSSSGSSGGGGNGSGGGGSGGPETIQQNSSQLAASFLVLNALGGNATIGGGNSSGANCSSGSSSSGFISVDFPLDGRGVQSVPAGDVLSPVLCMWVTMMAVYVANTLAGQPRLVQAAAEAAIPCGGSCSGSGTTGGGAGGAGGGAAHRGRRPSRADSSSTASAVRRAVSFRRAAAGTATAGIATAAEPAAAASAGADAARKGRHRSLEVKKPISKGLGKSAAAGAAARGAAAASALAAAGGAAARGGAAVAVAAARRSISSLRGLAASTSRLRRAASEYLHNSHPYLPALLRQVRRGMAALEPNHLAAELAEATGVPADLARALTRGSSLSALLDAALLMPSPAAGGPGALSVPMGADSAALSGGTGAAAAAGLGECSAILPGAGGGRLAGGGGGGRGLATAVLNGPPAATSSVALGPQPQPEFLDMVPWYSGTSADLFKTLFDLMVSVKLFLGRFDMRTMQAATAASMADSFNDTPSEGDGFTYEHLDERPQLWLDFIADTGDGGNPTYAVASALAAPALTVTVPEDLPLPTPPPPQKQRQRHPNDARKAPGADAKAFTPRPGRCLALPRGDVLMIGGDLAYPNPSRETYLQRLFRPFSDALPPPPHFHPGRLVVHKPDLPPAWGVQEAHLPCDLRGLSPRSSRRASSAALRRYTGPTAFAIPGNHDWIDGLETFTREIQHKGWLGGWLLPQEKSYFALRLPAGWWLFGFDLALVQDIDMQQYRYFANVVEQRMEPEDQVILMTHEPLWLLEWFWQRRSGANLRQLVRGHLRGRARLHLAGDLHFYMRHSWKETRQPPPAPAGQQQQGQQELGVAPQGPGGRPPLPPQPQGRVQRRGTAPEADTEASSGRTGSFTAAAAAVAASTAGDSDDAALCCGRSSASASVATSLEDLRPLGEPQNLLSPLLTQRPQPPPPPPAAPMNLQTHNPPGSDSSEPVAGDSSDEAVAPRPPVPHPLTLSGERPPAAAAPPAEPSAHLLDAASGLRGTLAEPQRWPHLKPPPSYPHRSPLPHQLHGEEEADLGNAGTRAANGPRTAAATATAGGAAQRGGLQLPLPEAAAPCPACEARQRWGRHPHDPEHLVVNGGGGAFLHPTHVFAGARFPAPHDPAADATAGLYAAVALPCTCGIYSPGAALYGGAPGGRIGPWITTGGWPPQQLGARSSSSSSLGAAPAFGPAGAATAASATAVAGGGGGGAIRGYAALGPDGEYVCAACYPSPGTSMQLGRGNLHVFRLRNTRFDVIGGAFYFLLVVSVLPRCSHLAEVLEADTPGRALSLLAAAYMDTLGAILGRSYLSAAALALLFLITLGLAKGGGVGTVQSSPAASESTAPSSAAATGSPGGGGASPPGAAAGLPAVRAPGPLLCVRLGGFPVQLAFATAHCLTHVSLAIVLLLLLELGVETCIKYESLGADGPHSLYRWYRAYEEQHFPDPMGLRQSLQRWTLGLYPGVLQVAMSVYDVPELIAVARTAMCAAGGSLEPISRLQAVAYYAGMLAYYWLLATPAMGFVFGLYLYLSVCWCHVHYDEAFSSLREASCKSFCRLHIGPDGDLRMYTLALDEVPSRWQEDARWRGPHGGGSSGAVAHEAHYPSRWMPARTQDAWPGPKQGGIAAQASPVVAGHSTGDGGGHAGGSGGGAAGGGVSGVRAPGVHWRLVDYVHVPRNKS